MCVIFFSIDNHFSCRLLTVEKPQTGGWSLRTQIIHSQQIPGPRTELEKQAPVAKPEGLFQCLQSVLS
jgi:hypothetical protein